MWGYYASDVNAAGSFSVTVAGSGIFGVHLREYAGVRATAPLGPTHTAYSTGALPDSGAITTTTAGTLYIAAQTHIDQLTTTVGAGWDHFVLSTDDQTSYQAFSTEDMIGVPPGTYDGTFGLSSADLDGWAVGIATFLPQ